MDYVILEDFELVNLQEKVNSYIKENYSPIGGITAVNQKEGFIEYLQAMQKNKD